MWSTSIENVNGIFNFFIYPTGFFQLSVWCAVVICGGMTWLLRSLNAPNEIGVKERCPAGGRWLVCSSDTLL